MHFRCSFRPGSRLWAPGLALLSLVLFTLAPAYSQDAGSAEREFFGNGVAITVVVHDPSGNPIASAAVVKLFRGGTLPAGRTETSRGVAEFVVNNLGEFTAVVEAAGYPRTEREFSIGANGRSQVDVYLPQPANTGALPPPGRPLLAPRAKKDVDLALQALTADKLSDAEKHTNAAAHLAPNHPDVLYLQGLLFLRQRQWSKAQTVLESATQLDPSNARVFAALGMALCDQDKYGPAVVSLEKSLQLNPEASWDTRWALAKAYYQGARYAEALRMSEAALNASNGKAPEIQLLVAQALTAVGNYEQAAQILRDFLRDHADRREAATARRWLDRLSSSGKIHPN